MDVQEGAVARNIIWVCLFFGLKMAAFLVVSPFEATQKGYRASKELMACTRGPGLAPLGLRVHVTDRRPDRSDRAKWGSSLFL